MPFDWPSSAAETGSLPAASGLNVLIFWIRARNCPEDVLKFSTCKSRQICFSYLKVEQKLAISGTLLPVIITLSRCKKLLFIMSVDRSHLALDPSVYTETHDLEACNLQLFSLEQSWGF